MEEPLFIETKIVNRFTIKEYKLNPYYRNYTKKRWTILAAKQDQIYCVTLRERLVFVYGSVKEIHKEFDSKKEAIGFVDEWIANQENQLKLKFMLKEKVYG